MNYWLRARVITQGKHFKRLLSSCPLPFTAIVTGFTIVAISWSAGVWERLFPGTAHERPGLLGPLPASTVGVLEGKEARKALFDERMRRAEEAHRAEAALESESAPKKIVISSKKVGKAKVTEEGHDLSGGHWRWLRWGSGSSQNPNNSSPSSLPPLPSPASSPPSADKPKPSGSWLRWVSGMSSSGSDTEKKP